MMDLTLQNRANLVEMLSVRQVIMRGVISGQCLRRLIRDGKIPTIKSGKVSYINYSWLIQQIQSPGSDIWH